MRVLLLSWEYPPVVIGGLGRHVAHLATELAGAGHDVTVLCRRPTGTDPGTHPTVDSRRDGVRVVAAAQDPHEFGFAEDMMAWVLAMGHAMLRAGLALIGAWWPEVVHAHDWLVAHPAVALAEMLDVPLVSTIHATEAGRHRGWLTGPINRQVHAQESWLARESDALIACSHSMRAEIVDLFAVDHTAPLAQVAVIPNGIDVAGWPFAARRRRTGGARLLFVGRLEFEKGLQEAIAALPRLRRSHRGATLTVVGDGTQRDWLVDQARRHRVSTSVRFAGHLDHGALLAELHAADAVVLPSHYEPFGIVALEAAAAGAPLVTSTAGGLGEAVRDGVTGMSFPPRDVAALARAVGTLLDDPATAQRYADAAHAGLASFAWRRVAARTTEVYAGTRRRPRPPLRRLTIAERALPDR